MAKISQQALAEVKKALTEWKADVAASNLTLDTQKTYIDHPKCFIRWLEEDYELPGNDVTKRF